MDLYKALEKGEFELYYQPQVNIVTGRVEGVEALVRWNHPIRGLITPDKFIPLAERLGLIGALGRWVLEEGCSQCMKWAAQGLGLLHISINLSAKQFVMDELAASVAAVMQKTGMLASNLTLELTESLLMNDVEQNVQIMRQLKELGVELSIDDFGTGYSSLSYLRRFPVDELKIDRSFLDDVANDDVAGAIVQSIISLAHSLRLKVVAEGVEGEDQLSFLRSKRCSLIQGYYYSRPLQAASLASFVRTFNRAF
jgi:EAL domain-containing protein (putative c-di-GMP-specific phosphodiesterase class I)